MITKPKASQIQATKEGFSNLQEEMVSIHSFLDGAVDGKVFNGVLPSKAELDALEGKTSGMYAVLSDETSRGVFMLYKYDGATLSKLGGEEPEPVGEKTVVFVNPVVALTGVQNNIINFPYTGKATKVIAVVSSENTLTEDLVIRIEQDTLEGWAEVGTVTVPVGSYKAESLVDSMVDSTLRLNITSAQAGITGLNVNVLISLYY